MLGPTKENPSAPTNPMIAATGNNENNKSLFSIEAPQTRVGRSCHAHNLEDLFICKYGSLVTKADIERKVNVIQCKRADCETRWVSKFYMIKAWCQILTDLHVSVPSRMYWP